MRRLLLLFLVLCTAPLAAQKPSIDPSTHADSALAAFGRIVLPVGWDSVQYQVQVCARQTRSVAISGAGRCTSQTLPWYLRPVAPPPPVVDAARVLFTESWDDAATGSRGWYDNTAPAIEAGTLKLAYAKGATKPANGGAMRHPFAPTDRIYLRYRVKYSDTWVGSGRNYHPHEFQLVTTEDDAYVGTASTRLTAYVEHTYQNGGVPRVHLTDSRNIDVARVNQDLTAVTEQRAIAGCNGNSDAYPTNCFPLSDTEWLNEKVWMGPGPRLTRGSWHTVEAYFQLNTLAGGKAVRDGIVRYWLDGALQIEHTDVVFRTGARPTMRFNQLSLAHYIGDGAPVAETAWFDSLVVATGRIGAPPVVVPPPVDSAPPPPVDTLPTPPPATAGVPELPSGYTLRQTWTGNPMVPSGWSVSSVSNYSLVADATAPVSSPVVRIRYPAGHNSGDGPGRLEWYAGSPTGVVVSFWMKYDPNFEGEASTVSNPSRVNKQLFVFGCNNVIGYTALRFAGYVPTGYVDFIPENATTGTNSFKWLTEVSGGKQVSVSKSAWTRVTFEVLSNRVRVWTNGTLIADAPITISDGSCRYVKIDPTWGGNTGARMQHEGYLFLDDVRIYTR